MSSVMPGLPDPAESGPAFDHITKDIKLDRPRWTNNFFFMCAALGSSIGLGNIWRFPSLTWKYGGEVFLPTYVAVLIAVGIPMLILELALGQKLQNGSMKAFGGISSRFAGVGHAAGCTGFLVGTIYIVLLGLALLYAAKTSGAGDKLPFAEANLNRPTSCQTASTYSQSAAQLFFYMNVTKLYTEDNCSAFKSGD